jgi:hypothetical protein
MPTISMLCTSFQILHTILRLCSLFSGYKCSRADAITVTSFALESLPKEHVLIRRANAGVLHLGMVPMQACGSVQSRSWGNLNVALEVRV